jgi:molybdopterin-containing oxidoreductase family iron-sulfur binding subunit
VVEIRRRLAARPHRSLWRSLAEAADSPAFLDLVREEFPRYAAPLDAGLLERREFLGLMGASLALAGLGACTRQPDERIVPYVRQPERMVLGEPATFATAVPVQGYAFGVLVESHEGRPTKIEGNPLHPASLGATDAIMQAAVLGLYDPDRAQVITSAGTIRTWTAFRAALDQALSVERARRGAGLRILTETVTSPNLAAGIEALLAAFPAARWHQWEPAGRDNVRAGARLAFGTDIETRYGFGHAAVVVALDADAFGRGPGHVRHTRDFTLRRRTEAGARLYVVEGEPSVTGAVADHRLPLGPREVEALARALAAALDVPGRRDAGRPGADPHPAFVAAVARDLGRHRGAGIVIAGEEQPPVVHALAHAINQRLDNVGRTVIHTDPVEAAPVDQLASLGELVDAMRDGDVELLLVLGGNPVYTAPADLGFAEALERVALRVHLGLYNDETSALCHWHLPEAHCLEAWDDARAFDGTVTILQPLIAPLYGGKTAAEIVAACLHKDERSSHDLVRAHWEGRRGGGDFEPFWRRALHDGVVAESALPVRRPGLVANWDPGPGAGASAPPATPAGAVTRIDVAFRPDPFVLDGRFANNGWLQELPRPVSRLTWDNAVLVAPATAERLGVRNEDVVELRAEERSIRGPVWIVPGHATGTATVHLGFGRARAGGVGNGLGFDAYRLRTTAARDLLTDVEVRPTGTRHLLATTQEHHSMEGRDLVRVASVGEYRAHPEVFAHAGAHTPTAAMTLYPGFAYDGHAWGMAIDLASCIGCNACTVACQAENNIPVVGKTNVLRGREMHWIRVDRYFGGDLDAPAIHHQPVPCMHCENAPCEVVCPVNATVHSSEGLNEMVYNRCVGTRYCSNNCPYKVRRFNFFLSANWHGETTKLLMNPDVTVRSRGVMEKCTYCVQRIERARVLAAREGRPIRDGDVVPACQQACPADAIVFGDVNDPGSRVARLKAEPRSYALLADRNTRPRTTYLGVLRNPNPELAAGHVEDHA